MRHASLVVALFVVPCLMSCGGGGPGTGVGGGLTANSVLQPSVAAMDPEDGATGVSADVELRIRFNVMLSKATLDEQTFLVIERGGDAVVGEIRFWDIFGPGLGNPVNELRFRPAGDLLPCTTYDVVMSGEVADASGRNLPAFLASFTTGGANCEGPTPPSPCVSPIDLGLAETYAVLAGSTVTNAGTTLLDGDLGLHPGSSVTGAPGVTGVTNIGNADAEDAKADLLTAYGDAVAAPTTASRIGDIGGQILTAGVYTSSSALSVEVADLILVGGPDSVFIFQMVSTLTIASGRKILLQGVRPCNVIWQVGSSATIRTGAQFVGTVLALTDITLETGATVEGRMLARNGQVVLGTNIVTVP